MSQGTARRTYRGSRAVVLGAAGFVGRWVARALCAEGANLTLVVRHRAPAATIFAAYGIPTVETRLALTATGALTRAMD